MLIGTVVFLSLIVILLAMPVTLTYQLAWKDTLSANLRLDWAFGLVRKDVSPDLESPGPDDGEAAGKKTARRGKAAAKRPNFIAAIRHAPFRRRAVRFVADLWRAIRKENVRLLVRLGLGDPADTGRLWAVLGPLSGMLARFRDIRVLIEPDFLDSTLEVDSSGTIRVIPLQVAVIVLGLLVSPSIWRGIISMRTSG